MDNHIPEKAVIYCRVASVTQGEEAQALAKQEQQCRDYAKQQQCSVEHIFSDTGVAGSLENTGMQAMLAFLKNQPEDYAVIVASTDRLTRDMRIYTRLHHAIQEVGGQVKKPD